MFIRYFFMVLLTLQTVVVSAETITLGDGATVTGRLGELKDDIVQFYGESYVTYKLDRIRDITVDKAASYEEQDKQKKNIQRFHAVIDREHFLKQDLHWEVNRLLLGGEFAALDALVLSFMQGQQRFLSGRLKEAEFFYGVVKDLPKRDVEKHRQRLLLVQEWIDSTDSEEAKIAFMQVSIDYAWAYRGGGYANTVNEEAKVRYVKILDEARRVGESLQQQGTQNISAFAKLIFLYKTLRNHNDAIRKLAIDAARIEPYYYGLHSVTISALLPKWGGSIDEVKTYVRRAHEKYGRKAGHEDLYYRLARTVFTYVKAKSFPRYDFNWARVKSSFQTYSEGYPITEKQYHYMAMMSGAMGDKEGFKYYLSQTSNQWNHFAKSVWRKKSALQRFSTWAERNEESQLPTFVTDVWQYVSKQLVQVLPEKVRGKASLYLYAGGDLDRRDVYGNTLLHRAVELPSRALVEQLLQAGADPYLLNSKGQNALYVAARLGRKDIVDVFITSGIDVNVQTASGMTILHIAASNGFFDLVKQVVLASPELLNHKTNFQKTALHFAVAKGHVEVVNYLLGLPNIKADAQNEKGFSALHYAAVNNYLPIVRMLVEHGVNTGLLTSRYQYTALNLSIERNYLEIVQYLKSVNAIENNSAVTYADRNKAIEVYEQAAPYYNRDEYDQGLVFIKQALEYDPSYAVAYHGLAVMYLYYVVDYQKAEAAIVKSLELDGSDVEAYYTAGRVYYALGDIDKSKPFFQEYVKLAPDTYNTQDLKKSYTYLLTNSTGLPSVAGSSFLNEGLFYFDKYRLPVTGILLLFLLLFLVVRRRNTSDSL